MKDDVSIRVTFSEKGAAVAIQIMDFIEAHFENISFQSPKLGSNPKYKEGGTHYDKAQGEFYLSYSRCNVKHRKPLLPKKRNG